MILNEHQAKKILADLGIPVPRGVTCSSAEMAPIEAARLSAGPWVVKAQVPAGGRGRGYFIGDSQARSGIRFADTAAQVQSNATQMLGSTLVTDQTGIAGTLVRAVYIEERCQTQNEYYLALTVDSESGQLVFIASPHGGSNIETLALESPAEIFRLPVELDLPVEGVNQLVDHLQIGEEVRAEFEGIVNSMLSEFVARDMLLLEINPLARDSTGRLVALDASIVFDDNALFRQGHPEQMEAYADLHDQEYTAAVHGFNYVKLEGDIATLSAGAGLAMATIDAIQECGGKPANFLDVPPSTTAETLKIALQLLTRDSATRCILLNIFGGGIMRCDAVADAVMVCHAEQAFKVPLVVRLAGTNAKLARQRLSASLPSVYIADDLADAAKHCVEISYTAPGQPATKNSLWSRVRKLVAETGNE